MSSDKIRISTEKLEDISQQLDQLSRSLTNINISLVGIASSANYVLPGMSEIVRNLNSLNRRVSASGSRAKKLATGVRNASAKWAETENQLVVQGKNEPELKTESGDASLGKQVLDKALDFLGAMVGDACPVTKVGKALWDGITNFDVRTWIKSGADILDAVVNVVQANPQNVKADWIKALFNTAPINMKPMQVFADKVTDSLGWTVEGIKAAVDNFDIAKEGNYARFVTETAAETATSVVLTALGSTAAVAVLGTTAPAWLVGAAGAGVVWVANTVVESVSGKTITQWAGEAVGNATDAVVDAGKKFFKAGSKAIANAGETVCGWFSAVFA